MKQYLHQLLFTATCIYLLASCSPPDKKAELEKLKITRAELETKIKDLEAELASTGSDTTDDHARTILVDELKAITFKNYVEVQGHVDADENITLSAEMGGQVMRILVKAGDEVSKGQLLAETDNKLILKGMAELQGGLDLATTMYEKQKNLWDQKIGTELQYLTAKNQKEGLEKKMASMQEQLELTRISSPIAGTVDAVHIKTGQVIGPGMPAITVVNFSSLKVKAEVPESYAHMIKKGDDMVVVFPDMKDSVTGKINYAARVINPLNRTFTVEMLLDNTKLYHPNMIAILKINDYTSEKPVIVIPVSVIMRSDDGINYVMIEENKKAKKVIIKSGKKYQGRTEILEGLKEGDHLVTKGFQELNEGDEVKF